jgi:hypothetical protein
MYYILLNELEKPKFDTHFEGALLNSKNELTPNIFGNGRTVKKIADVGYSIIVDEDFSLPGKLRDRLLVYVHNSDHLLIVSTKMQQLLNEIASEDVEFYNFQFTHNNTTRSDYKIVNVLNKIDCTNYEESEIDFESYDDNDIGQGSIYTIDSLVLDISLTPQHLSIFLLGNHEDSIIIVHERLIEKIKSLSLSGFVFCKPEELQL